jgi:hypothetical protein
MIPFSPVVVNSRRGMPPVDLFAQPVWVGEVFARPVWIGEVFACPVWIGAVFAQPV